MNTSHDYTTWLGRQVLDSEGNQLGRIRDIYEDEETGQASWASVQGGILGTSTYYIPLNDAHLDDADVRVNYDYDMIRAAPKMHGDEFGKDMASELSNYYHHPQSETVANNTVTDNLDIDDDVVDEDNVVTDKSVDLHKEQLDIDTEARPYAKARLHKYTVTRNETITVPIVEEHAKLVFDDSPSARTDVTPDFGDRDVEIVLNREEPVVTKQVVRAGTARVQIEQTQREVPITAEIREEKVDLVDADHDATH